MWDIIRQVGGLLYYPNIPTWTERYHGFDVVQIVDGKAIEEIDISLTSISSSFNGRDIWGLGSRWGKEVIIEYRTPIGTLSAKRVWSDEMAADGVQMPQLKEWMIKSVEDYPIMEYVLEHTEFVPDYSLLKELQASFRDEGVVIGGAGFTPIHLIMLYYIGYNDCFFQMHDHPKEFERLLQITSERLWDVKKIAAQSPAEILMVGCNWSDSITSPPIFKKYFVHHLEEVVDLMHSHGKLTSCHVDGDMKRLLDLFVGTGVDIAEALAPMPLGNYSIEEAREAFSDRLTIWGGIPTPLFTSTYSDEEFVSYIRNVLQAVAPGNRFILAMADNIPPNGRFDRVSEVKELVDQWANLPLDPDRF
jgi:uroporphyrinogen-III decarboxylase